MRASATRASSRATSRARRGSCAAPSTPARARPRTRSGRACSWRRCCSSRATPTRPPRSTATRSRCFPTTRAPRPASAPSPSRAAIWRWPSAGTPARPRTSRCPTSSRSSATCARRAATRPARSEAYALVRVEQALFVRAGGNADLETALFEASHPGAQSRAVGRRAGAQGAGLPPLGVRPRRTRLGALLGREVPPGPPAGQAREPPRHGRPAALVAPRRDRRLRREARRGTRGAAARAGAHAALPSARRPGRAPAAWRSCRDDVPSGTRGECHLAFSARSSQASRWPRSCPRRVAHPLGQLHGQPVHAARSRRRPTSPCATCSTWPRSRRSSGGEIVDANGDGRISTAEAAQEKQPAGRDRRAAPAARWPTASPCGSCSRSGASRSRTGRAGSRRRGSMRASARSG